MSFLILAVQQRGSRDWNDNFGPWIIVVLLIIAAAIIGYANYQNARRFRIESSTSLTSTKALDALQSNLARDGWQLGFRDDTSLVMNITRSASIGSTAAIGCFSIWLGLLHVVSSRGSIIVEFEATDSANGSSIVANGSQSGNALRNIAHHLNGLPSS